MAYLRPEDDEQGQGQQGQLYSTEGQAAEAGQDGGAPSAGGTGAAPASTAGRAGGFSNVMDFLKANRGNQALQSQIRGAGEEVLSGARAAGQQTLGQQREQLGQVQAKTLGAGDIGDITKVRSALTQQYQAPDVTGAFGATQQGARQKLGELSGGSIQGLGSLYQRREESPLYRPGMRALDESLLSQDQEFMTQFIPQLQQRYQQEVAQPLEQEAGALQLQAKQKAEEIAAARGKSSSVLQDFLKGQQAAVDAELARQQAAAPVRVAGTQEVDPSNQGSMIDMRTQLESQLRQAGIDPAKFSTVKPGTVSRETAAEAALGGDKIAQYNALAQLLGEVGGPQVGQLTGGAKFAAGKDVFDQKAAEQAMADVRAGRYRENQAQSAATQAALTKGKAETTSKEVSQQQQVARTNDSLREFLMDQAGQIMLAQAGLDRAKQTGNSAEIASFRAMLQRAQQMQPSAQLQQAARENLGQEAINRIVAEQSKKSGVPLTWGVSNTPEVSGGGGSGTVTPAKKRPTV